ncbi:YmfQ family protein [Methylobacterium soli]|uniref:DUF2313 domain-containing protein n=1 Tax=Methylobacterium soli TaxID=553447 RepID=A0A6L3T386_9HYPH|nr:putative phage tail protein [Methylobacterium soli]KAB1079407.1 DUF2313 domain-containing protein [Methylobacterium soli]GJE45378.1 hypothetical protein AEGHOMDF_4572 [Methylobacterium soli]
MDLIFPSADGTVPTVDWSFNTLDEDGANRPRTRISGQDRFVRRSGDDYAEALAALLPVGAAWPRDPKSTLMGLVSGLGQIWGGVDGRAADLLEIETDPRFTTELLSEWERAFGLPDTCTVVPTTVEARRDALLAKMTALGGQSRAYFYGLAAALGYQVKIVEWSPYQGGVSRAGDTRPTTGSRRYFRAGASGAQAGIDPHLRLPTDLEIVGPYRWHAGDAGHRAWWRVIVGARTFTCFRSGLSGGRAGTDHHLAISPPHDWFRAGAARAGERHHLEYTRARDLECLFERWKPAHSRVTFHYGGLPISAF